MTTTTTMTTMTTATCPIEMGRLLRRPHGPYVDMHEWDRLASGRDAVWDAALEQAWAICPDARAVIATYAAAHSGACDSDAGVDALADASDSAGIIVLRVLAEEVRQTAAYCTFRGGRLGDRTEMFAARARLDALMG